MYPDTPNFEPSRMECPRCGATNSNRSEDRVVQGNTRFELDSDGFRVVFEVACPCGFRHEITIDWEDFDDDHTWPEDVDEPIPYAHVVEIDEEEPARCEECGAKHAVGPELEPEERGCMCGGDLILTDRIDEDDLIPGFPEPGAEQ